MSGFDIQGHTRLSFLDLDAQEMRVYAIIIANTRSKTEEKFPAVDDVEVSLKQLVNAFTVARIAEK
ncbi:13354_t:CDS:2 [Funneliformis mosseae]|uniref:13354_t:CDS:1 n=1 Tax=Funneliformis mosseae TaxID=27381 RepID=A0A9N9BMP4_FUNMO|nr:13354_t:CDS:2 [Funneliformis mosseae]